MADSLVGARRSALVAMAMKLGIANTWTKTKSELSVDIWAKVNELVDMVNAPPVSPIAPVLWVGGVLGGACVCELFTFVLSRFLLPLCGVKRPALRGVRRCLLSVFAL